VVVRLVELHDTIRALVIQHRGAVATDPASRQPEVAHERQRVSPDSNSVFDGRSRLREPIGEPRDVDAGECEPRS
jgi:hypothetical protein